MASAIPATLFIQIHVVIGLVGVAAVLCRFLWDAGREAIRDRTLPFRPVVLQRVECRNRVPLPISRRDYR
jgi:hypothetical protein